MQSSKKLIQSKREYNPDDLRNKRIARGTRTSRRLGTKSRVNRARELAVQRKQKAERRESRRFGQRLSAGLVERES